MRLTQGPLKLTHVVIGLSLGDDYLHAVTVIIFGSLCVLHSILRSIQPENEMLGCRGAQNQNQILGSILHVETLTSDEEWKTCLRLEANCLVEVDNGNLWASIPNKMQRSIIMK